MRNPPPLTHADLVKRAVRWLRSEHRCSIVLAEMTCTAPSIPDAIGWHGSFWSILVECKVSRSDFMADRKKLIHLDPDNAPGQERWYLTPPGILKPQDVPAGWWLAEVYEKRIVKVTAPVKDHRVGRIPSRIVAEAPFLLSALRRHHLGVPFDTSTGRFQTIEERERGIGVSKNQLKLFGGL